MKIRKTFTENCSDKVKGAFKERYLYDHLTGEISHSKVGRLYTAHSYKNYRRDLYLVVDRIEYRVTYHRLCWFLYYGVVIPDGVQIDHINNIKNDNRIVNLRLCSNDDNSKKKPKRSDNVSGYKGVAKVIDTNQQGKKYLYYIASIALEKKAVKIGRFKAPIDAAKYYDSAARYYYKDFSLCNFEEQFLKPMSIEELKAHKNLNFVRWKRN